MPNVAVRRAAAPEVGAGPAVSPVAGFGVSLQLPPLPPSLDIIAVSPPNPVEHTPIIFTFSLTNSLNRVLNGQVSSGRASVRISSLAPGASINGTVAGVAPAAGPVAQLSIDFFDDDNRLGGEFPQPNSSAFIGVGVSATYALTFDSLLVKIRCNALENDNLTGSVTAKLGDSPLGNPDVLTDNSGTRDVLLGDVSPNLNPPTPLMIRFAPVMSLAGNSPPLNLSYAFVSHGGQEVVKSIMNILSDAAQGILDVVYPQATEVWKTINSAVQGLHDLIFGSCGRPVVVDNIAIPSGQLLAVTAATGSYTQVKEYITPQPSGYPCQGSDYILKFTITRTSFKP